MESHDAGAKVAEMERQMAALVAALVVLDRSVGVLTHLTNRAQHIDTDPAVTPRLLAAARESVRGSTYDVWATAGADLVGRAPPEFLRRVVWRVGAAEAEVDKLDARVPHPLTRPAAALLVAKIDVTPDDALEMSRGNAYITDLVLQIEEARLRQRPTP